MNSKTLVVAGSVLTAFLASLCCIGPVLFTLVGAGALGFAAAFEPYRAYLLATAALLLAGAFYLTYRKREVRCADGSCKTESGSSVSKIALWIIAGLVLALIFFPNLLTFF